MYDVSNAPRSCYCTADAGAQNSEISNWNAAPHGELPDKNQAGRRRVLPTCILAEDCRHSSSGYRTCLDEINARRSRHKYQTRSAKHHLNACDKLALYKTTNPCRPSERSRFHYLVGNLLDELSSIEEPLWEGLIIPPSWIVSCALLLARSSHVLSSSSATRSERAS
jgi:hypothetical protein